MSPIPMFLGMFLFSSVLPEAGCSVDQCRNLEFRAAQMFEGKRLINHMIRSADVMDNEFCGALCYMEPNCFSYNLVAKNEVGKLKCELSNATHEGNEEDLEENPNYIYRGAKNACVNNLCKNKATCQTGFIDRGYRCLCSPGFSGQDCESDIDECAVGTHSCSVDAACNNTEGSYNCTCKSGYYGDGHDCEDIDECATEGHNCSAPKSCYNTKGSYECLAMTCKDLYDSNSSSENKAYRLNVGNESILVYCHLTNAGLGACGGGGWTLVMKIDGTQSSFHYDSSFWTNNEIFNPTGGETGFDTHETKLPTYWSTPFSKICLGMKIPGESDVFFIAINKTADSLYSLIADGQFRATSLGRDTWKTLLGSHGSLQVNCNREGFNAVSDVGKARIGFLGNNENHCASCDSRIGFGTAGYPDNSNTCGNVAAHETDNGDKDIKAMGYIFVQ
ncbi:uncharacterized protein LOC144634592 [Oculina patagonica]